MTPAERAQLLANARVVPGKWFIPIRVPDLIELLEVAVACDQAAETEAVDQLRAQLDGPGLS